MGQIWVSPRQPHNAISIILKSNNSIDRMIIDPYETFGKIATRYCLQDHHRPSSGINLYYNDYEIRGLDTAHSLGIKNGTTLKVKW